ncbi:hypothetical protein ACKI1O_51440, partial [Streptomyces scabiei]
EVAFEALEKDPRRPHEWRRRELGHRGEALAGDPGERGRESDGVSVGVDQGRQVRAATQVAQDE